MSNQLPEDFKERIEQLAGAIQANVQQFIRDSENWITNLRASIEQQLPNNIPNRDEVINTVSDSLIDVINRLRTIFTSSNK